MALKLGEARCRGTVENRVVLEWALSAAVADRAIERVIDQQKLKNAFAVTVHHFGVRKDDHVVVGRQGATGLGLGHLADATVGLLESNLDEAHTAHADWLHARVVAKNGNF